MKFKIFKKVIFVFIAVASLNCLVLIGNAASPKQDMRTQLQGAALSSWGAEPSVGNNLSSIVQTVISALLGLLGIIFLVLIIYAGFNWMTAQGDEEKVTTAKDTLTRAIIGLVIITMAYAITFFVFTYMLPAGDGGGLNVTTE